jgi:hypothetical protein
LGAAGSDAVLPAGLAHALREICGGLASCEGKLSHLGIQAPRRSGLAYANAQRPWQLYEHFFYRLLERCRAAAPWSRKVRFKHKLVSLGSTVLGLCVLLFDWPRSDVRRAPSHCI